MAQWIGQTLRWLTMGLLLWAGGGLLPHQVMAQADPPAVALDPDSMALDQLGSGTDLGDGSMDLMGIEEEAVNSGAGDGFWLKRIPSNRDWLIGLGAIVLIILFFYAVYRLLLLGHVRKIKSPASLRALIWAFIGISYLVWMGFWFMVHLHAFGLLAIGITVIIGLAIVLAGYLSKR
jgi:hypothetical protein